VVVAAAAHNSRQQKTLIVLFIMDVRFGVMCEE
jgi:hypothetical protein